MHRRQFITLAGAGTMLLAGCAEDEQSGGDQSPQGTTSDPATGDGAGTEDTQSTTEEQSESAEAIVGERVAGENMSMVVESVSRATEIGEFQEADPGNEFVITTLAVKNTTQDQFVNFSGFLQTQLKDSEDYTYEQTFAITGNTFQGGQLAPGEVSRGDIVYEVPEDASGLVLQFDFTGLSIFKFDRVTVDLAETTDSTATLQQNLAVLIHSPGESVSHEGVTVAVNSVEYAESLGSFAEAKSGHEYAIVDITTTNNTDEELRLSTLLQMKMKDGAGNSYDINISALSALDQPYNESQPIAAGESRRGKLGYEVPTDSSPLYWIFEFVLWVDGNKAFWAVR